MLEPDFSVIKCLVIASTHVLYISISFYVILHEPLNELEWYLITAESTGSNRMNRKSPRGIVLFKYCHQNTLCRCHVQ